MKSIQINPQPGPQSKFLSSSADIALLGGAAGGGKSFALLLDPLYGYDNKLFTSALFRRTTVQLKNPGGIWDQSHNLYYPLRGKPKETTLEWEFPSGAGLKMAHLEYENNVYDWQGSELTWIGFDEITHFTEKQVTYMMSRLRSMSGIKPKMRGSCNPDAESWIRQWVDWYVGEDGFPIYERSGILRWFIRVDDTMVWADNPKELTDKYGKDFIPRSFTFIPAKLSDNQILMKKDPSYLATLKSMARVERMRLLEGNWNVKPSSGAYFQKSYFEVIDAVAAEGPTVRYWDRASTKVNESNKDPDWTVGLKMRRLNSGLFVVMDVVRFRDTPLEVEKAIKNTATQDGKETEIVLEQDPGQAGVSDVQNYMRNVVPGYTVRLNKVIIDKITRCLPASAQAEQGNIKVLRGKWNGAFFQELENFPPEKSKGKDDQVDAFSGAYTRLAERPRTDWLPVNLMGTNRFA